MRSRRAGGPPVGQKMRYLRKVAHFFLTRLDLVASCIQVQPTIFGNRSTGRLIAASSCPSRLLLVAVEAVRVPGLGSSMWRRGLHARGGIHKAERPSKSRPARQYGSAQARPSRTRSIRRLQSRLPGRRLHHQRDPQRRSKPSLAARLGHCARALPDPQRDWGIFYHKAARAVAFAAAINIHNPASSTR